MFKVVCIKTHKAFGIVEGEIYEVLEERYCPKCGNRTYKIYGLSEHFHTACTGHGEKIGEGFVSPEEVHYQFPGMFISHKFFRLADLTFGEKIASEIESKIIKEWST